MRQLAITVTGAVLAAVLLMSAADPAAAQASKREPERSGQAARAACPFCVFAAAAAVRGAMAVRAASAARAAVVAARVAREQAANLAKLSREKMARVRKEADKVADRGKKWLKRNWGTLKRETQMCLATIAFMEAHGYLKDRVLSVSEWSAYSTFGPRLVTPVETLELNLPIRFDAREIASKAYDEAVECAFGIGVGKWWPKKSQDGPQPD